MLTATIKGPKEPPRKPLKTFVFVKNYLCSDGSIASDRNLSASMGYGGANFGGGYGGGYDSSRCPPRARPPCCSVRSPSAGAAPPPCPRARVLEP